MLKLGADSLPEMSYVANLVLVVALLILILGIFVVGGFVTAYLSPGYERVNSFCVGLLAIAPGILRMPFRITKYANRLDASPATVIVFFISFVILIVMLTRLGGKYRERRRSRHSINEA